MRKSWLNNVGLRLLPVLIVTGCATSSPPIAPACPKIPAPSQSLLTPEPSGNYSVDLKLWREGVSSYLPSLTAWQQELAKLPRSAGIK